MADRRALPHEDVIAISSMLENYHKVFYVFFSLAGIYFDDGIKTAAIQFHKHGKPIMLINEEFWKSLNKNQRVFVVCHECMHVLLDHGNRDGSEVKGATHDDVNIAQDITINEMIVDLFDYDREDFIGWEKYAWIDTCFKNPKQIKRNETFIYYLEELLKNPSEQKKNNNVKLIDDHKAPPKDGEPAPSPSHAETVAKEKFANTLAEELTADELGVLLDALGDGPKAGTMRGSIEAMIKKKEQRVRLRINRLIAKLKRTRIKMIEGEGESFTAHDRRFASFFHHNPDMSLPGKIVKEVPSKDRLLVALFMDVSGSCMSYFPDFKKIASAFIAEEKMIETIPYAFDTAVTPIVLDQPLHIGGGTYFHIIEEECQRLTEKFGRYPDCVMVVTDGEGNPVVPAAPSRWIWLLTPRGSKQYVNPSSRSYPISEVVFE